MKPVFYKVLIVLLVFSVVKPSYADPFDISTLRISIENVDGMAVADFSGDASQDVLLVGRSNQRQKQLQIITLAQGTATKQNTGIVDLDNNVLFYNTAKLAGSDKTAVLFLQPGKIVRYDPADQKLHTLFEVDTIYRHSSQQTSFINQLSFAIDINGDGLSDFILPDFEYNRIFIQQPDGSFTPQVVDMLAQRRLFRNNSAVYVGSPVYLADFNFDGETDLIYRVKSDLKVFFQRKGVFDRKAKVIALDLALPLSEDYDDLNKDHSDKVTHSFYKLMDLNNDQILDMLTKVTKSSGLLDKTSQYQFYFGKKGEQGEVVFGKTPGSVISSEGIQFELTLVDFNGDEQIDLVSPSYELGVGSIISSLFSSSADLDIMFHPLSNSNYQTKPNLEKELTVDFNLTSGQQVYPLLKISDFDGDGLNDLLIGNGSKKIYLYKGVKNSALFAKRSQRFKMQLPRNGQLVAQNDLNNDGKTDLIIRYDKLDGKELSGEMKILLAR